jgi:hypothetical protein
MVQLENTRLVIKVNGNVLVKPVKIASPFPNATGFINRWYSSTSWRSISAIPPSNTFR